jgi:DNA polymerase-3 subunit alpha
MLDGHGKVDKYAERAAELGMTALAQTDHGNVHGWLDFYEACKKVDIKPILGLEAYQARKSRFDRDPEERSGPAQNEWDQRGPYHLTVLASNEVGYKNLIKLSSKAYTEGFYVKPRIDHQLVSQYSDGLIVLSGCLNGELQQALLRGDYAMALKHASTMQDIVGKENYFVEIQDHGLAEQKSVKQQTLEIAKAIGAKVVVTGDCHYVNKSDAHYHDVMLCSGTKSLMDQENRFRFSGDEFYLKSYAEMESTFESEWLDNTLLVAEMVNIELEFNEFHFPEFPDVPKDIPVEDHLEKLVWEGIRNRYGDPIPSEVVARTTHELGVVNRMGFPHYFLVVSDIVRWAKENDIRVGWGRGSAAGSILSYALEITNLDPLKFGLLFERFLVEGRKSMPDIDLDFDDRYRDKVIEYVRNRYGNDHVAHICTFGTVGARSAIRDTTRVLGYEYKVGDDLAKLVPPDVLGVAKSLDEALKSPEMLKKYESDPDAKIIIDTAKGIEGIHRQTGIHAAGVVISRKPLIEYIPVMQKGENAPVVTQWDMNRVEQNGLLKIDFLGLRNLGVVDMAEKLINERHGTSVDCYNLPLDDEGVYKYLSKGNSMGIFQVESRGMRDMMLSMRPDRIEDIMGLISLYRPGPLGSGMDKIYIDRKHGRKNSQVPHPKLEDVLQKSRGVMLYQEDVINVARVLANFSASEADDLRKVIGKKQMDKVHLFRDKFVDGCKKHSDVDSSLANKIYSDIEYFAGYGFNKAHAASYAVLSYITAWLKYYYPLEYMTALLTSVATNKDKLSPYLNECRKMSINVLPPSMKDSSSDFTISDEDEIIFGFSAIDGIGESKVQEMLANRGSSNIWEFLRTCESGVINRATLEHLIKSGAFDELSPGSKKINRSDKLNILEMEKDELGLYVTDHPLLGIWDFITPKISCEIEDLKNVSEGELVTIGGIVAKKQSILTKANKQMYRLQIDDVTTTAEVVVFPKYSSKINDHDIESGSLVTVSGNVAFEGDEENLIIKILLTDIEKLDISILHGGKPIRLKSAHKPSYGQVSRIYDIISNVSGDSPVYLEFPDGSNIMTMKFNSSTSDRIEEELQQIIQIFELEREL